MNLNAIRNLDLVDQLPDIADDMCDRAFNRWSLDRPRLFQMRRPAHLRAFERGDHHPNNDLGGPCGDAEVPKVWDGTVRAGNMCFAPTAAIADVYAAAVAKGELRTARPPVYKTECPLPSEIELLMLGAAYRDPTHSEHVEVSEKVSQWFRDRDGDVVAFSVGRAHVIAPAEVTKEDC